MGGDLCKPRAKKEKPKVAGRLKVVKRPRYYVEGGGDEYQGGYDTPEKAAEAIRRIEIKEKLTELSERNVNAQHTVNWVNNYLEDVDQIMEELIEIFRPGTVVNNQKTENRG